MADDDQWVPWTETSFGKWSNLTLKLSEWTDPGDLATTFPGYMALVIPRGWKSSDNNTYVPASFVKMDGDTWLDRGARFVTSERLMQIAMNHKADLWIIMGGPHKPGEVVTAQITTPQADRCSSASEDHRCVLTDGHRYPLHHDDEKSW